MKPTVDDVLVEWGARLFYGHRNYSKRPGGKDPMAPLAAVGTAVRAGDVRARIAAITKPGARQVMVKITGGGRGMKQIAAHLTYISKHGQLPIENERGEHIEGKDALRDLQDEWRMGRTYIPDRSHRREAYHLMFSMPAGTSPEALHDAVRAVAREHLANHSYAMVLHEHQAHPHVHLAVKAEGFDGSRLNPRKADLRTWRASFARELQARGIEAVATAQPVHGASRLYPTRWRVAANEDARERTRRPDMRTSARAVRSRYEAFEAWGRVHDALVESSLAGDQELATSVAKWLRGSKDVAETRQLLAKQGAGLEKGRDASPRGDEGKTR